MENPTIRKETIGVDHAQDVVGATNPFIEFVRNVKVRKHGQVDTAINADIKLGPTPKKLSSIRHINGLRRGCLTAC